MPELLLEVDGVSYRGWESVQIARSLESAAGSFQLAVSNREGWPIAPGSSCRVSLDGDPVLTGHVDRVVSQLSASARSISVAGRDATADLVDCSAVNEPGEWLQAGLARIASEIAEPFGVSTVIEGEAGEPFLTFGVQPGESAFEAIERAARMRGLLVTSSPAGELLLTRPSDQVAGVALVEGANILAARAELDVSGRFGRYLVRGQHPGADLFGTGAVVAPQGEAFDQLARPERVLLVLAEAAVTDAEAADRAAWEATWRAARGSRVTVTVQGWRQRAGGELWRTNLLVDLEAPRLGISGRFLIGSIAYSLTESTGTTTELELARPDAWTPQTELEPEGDPLEALLARYGLGGEE